MTDESSAAGQDTPPSAKGPSLNGLHIAALESRRASDMERLIAKYGGTPHVSPSMREVAVSEHGGRGRVGARIHLLAELVEERVGPLVGHGRRRG